MSVEKKFTRNKQEKIKLILKTAYDLIIENGYDKLSTNHIADRANIGIGTIYRNFPNGKADIIREIVNRNRKKIVNLDLFAEIKYTDLLNSVKQTMLNFIKFHRKNYQFHLAFEQAFLANKELFQDFEYMVEDMIKELIKKLKENRIFRDVPDKDLMDKIMLIFNVLESIILRHILIMPLFDTDDEFGDYLTKLVIYHFSN